MKRLLSLVLLALLLLSACGGGEEEAPETPPALGGFGTGPVESVQEASGLSPSDGGQEPKSDGSGALPDRPDGKRERQEDRRTIEATPPGAAEGRTEDDSSAWKTPSQQEESLWTYQPEDGLWYCWNEDGLWCYWEETTYWYYRENDGDWYYLAVDGYWYPCREDPPLDQAEGGGNAPGQALYGGADSLYGAEDWYRDGFGGEEDPLDWNRQESYPWYGQEDSYDRQDPSAPHQDPVWPFREGQGQLDLSSVTYIVNTGTMRFHTLDCSSVSEIQPRNRMVWTGTREELLAEVYRPCGLCHP